ncbi:MAG: DNA replication/repair protein RecF [Actinobacteria bacterium]|uniref:DNA replication and repair protein RecF n=1 Tax=freshwater metagenome TaxID=449393 RepID=A0A6J7F1Z5_9ZZZZ|nr:DNA replication/repair protein RecF [Actinomycetota bacterium]
MRVQRLSLRDFRNYSAADLDLRSGVSVFQGKNGQGKTNLVEAVYALAHGRSHRLSHLSGLIRKGADSTIVRATVVSGDRSLNFEWEINREGPGRHQLSGNLVKALDFSRSLSVVMFAPEDITLIRGEPVARRGYIDDVACSLSPKLRGTLADYDRTIKQRNSLLKSLRLNRRETTDYNTLDIWDQKLVSLGAEIVTARENTVSLLRPFLVNRYATISGTNDDITVTLHMSVTTVDAPYAQSFADQLRERRADDIDRGQTTVGPHRDDLNLSLNELPAKGYASHGESWSFVLALRLAELDLKRSHGPAGDPIVILDDVFAELDSQRRMHLAESLLGVEQVLITAAVEEDIPESLRLFVTRISDGKILDESVA